MPFFISAGFLCGSCPSGSWVSLDILSCSDTCEVGVVLFFIWCKLVIHLYSSHSCIHACAQPDQLWHQMQLGTQACSWMCIPIQVQLWLGRLCLSWYWTLVTQQSWELSCSMQKYVCACLCVHAFLPVSACLYICVVLWVFQIPWYNINRIHVILLYITCILGTCVRT